ncbi:transmembrane protein 70 homolog, mitochondrial [Colletes gigas]|uniref:transmembrane protein 70 homolog, mitochondrial n=1 Tax=Colletes gigas TaxID=935657 RepID=UPI001C9BAAE1|nr:transmembrane protein 70 homolog, mitochondrial [Colletes gigas]
MFPLTSSITSIRHLCNTNFLINFDSKIYVYQHYQHPRRRSSTTALLRGNGIPSPDRHAIPGGIINQKCASTLHIKHFSTESNKELERTLIYTGKLSNKIRNIKIFSFVSSFGTLLFQPMLYMRAVEQDAMLGFIGMFGILGFFTIGNPLLIHSIARKYVTSLYYYPKEDKYVAEIYSLFLRKKEITFTADEVHVPNVDGMFSICYVKGSPLFFNQDDFEDVTHYNNIMGLYKPIDFKMNNVMERIKAIEEDDNHLELKKKKQ